MKAGDVFRLVNVADKHAKIIISDPRAHPEKVVFVGMTSWDRLEDQTCILEPMAHSTVEHRTCIAYTRANMAASNSQLDHLRDKGHLKVFEPVSDGMLQQIRKGAMSSPRTPKEVKDMLVAQGLV